MLYKRGQTYWYKFSWSIRQRDGTSSSFLVRRSARTRISTEAEEVEYEHPGRSALARFPARPMAQATCARSATDEGIRKSIP